MRTAAWWLAAAFALALVVTYVAGRAAHDTIDARAAYFAATMTVGMGVGLWAWAWRPRSHMGPLMFWWPALWIASDLPAAFPDSSTASTVGVALFVMGPIVFAQMALSYPLGRFLQSRLAWIYVFVLGYAAQIVQNVYNMLFLDLRDCPVCPPPTEPTWLHVGREPPISLQAWNDDWLVFVLAILPIGLFVLYRAYVQANVANRRSLGPVLLTATFITVTSWITGYAALTDRFSLLSPISWLQTTGALAAALTALIGLAVVRRARGSVGDLVVELDRAGPGAARDALAKAFGDPSLELALRLPDRGIWVDGRGAEMSLPTGSDRAVTMVGEDLAAVIHDPILFDQPALVEAGGSAVRLALENERLQAELRAQLEELRRSRERIVRAGDEERQRLERDLHDGAQQRFLSVGMSLQRLRARLGDDSANDVLAEAEDDLRLGLAELRDLARGIRLPVLADQGLSAALRALADRSFVSTSVDAGDERLPPPIESALYFVAAEALANVAKHAHASHVWISFTRANGTAQLAVQDDGSGGAQPHDGSGLSGLSDRVRALGGRLVVDSAQGRGTRVEVSIPCE
jgi:signal transduction histidine kinase